MKSSVLSKIMLLFVCILFVPSNISGFSRISPSIHPSFSLRGPTSNGVNQNKHGQTHFHRFESLHRIPLFMTEASSDVSKAIKTYDCKLDEKQVCEKILILVFLLDFFFTL